MKQLTVRGVEEELHSILRKQAESQGVSVNKYILRILREVHHLEESSPETISEKHHDLDYLAGTWNEEDEKEFSEERTKQRQIDGDIW